MEYIGNKATRSYSGYLGLLERISNNEWPNYTFISSQYETSGIKIKVYFSEHGGFKITPHKLMGGRGCRDCWIFSSRTGHEEYINKLDKTFEEFNRTHQENITRKKRRQLGAFILSIGVVLNIIIIAFWN